METLILFSQIVGLSLVTSLVVVGGIVVGVWVGKTISQEVF